MAALHQAAHNRYLLRALAPIGDALLLLGPTTLAHPQANVILRAVGAAGELALDEVSGRINLSATGENYVRDYRKARDEWLARMLREHATEAEIADLREALLLIERITRV